MRLMSRGGVRTGLYRSVRAISCGLILGGILVEASGAGAAMPQDCERLLSASRELLDDGPVLKEELATGVMWMRLEAERRRDAGDSQGCVLLAGQAENLLRQHRNSTSDAARQ